MDTKDRRKHIRVKISNFIMHESIDKEGKIVSSSMGKALNVSRSGIMLETAHPIEAENVLLMTVDLDNNLMEMKGRLIYCRETDSGMYQSGINFTGSKDETSQFAVKLIKLYHHRKHNLTMHVAA